MNDFKDIQNMWQDQGITPGQQKKELFKSVQKKGTLLKHKHLWTQFILTLSCVVIIGFFFVISGWRSTLMTVALCAMALILLIRILMEIISLKKFMAIKVSQNFRIYHEEILRFYNWRKVVHFIFTPIFLVLYSLSFLTLMPIFKKTVSAGFYLYIQVSGVVAFIGITMIILFQIKKEISILNYLKDINLNEDKETDQY